tara:strand:+ start:363 stop:569 length:207 start_codon:yes stop_codon:yes gene_type:complete
MLICGLTIRLIITITIKANILKVAERSFLSSKKPSKNNTINENINIIVLISDEKPKILEGEVDLKKIS